MPEIYCETTIKGEKGEVETKALLNSGSDYLVIPREIAEKVSPKLTGEDEFLLGDGRIIKKKIYDVEVTVKDSRGRTKSCSSLATIEDRPDVLLGLSVMEKLKMFLDITEGKATFKE